MELLSGTNELMGSARGARLSCDRNIPKQCSLLRKTWSRTTVGLGKDAPQSCHSHTKQIPLDSALKC